MAQAPATCSNRQRFDPVLARRAATCCRGQAVDSVAAVSISAKSESSIEALTIAGAGSLGLRPGGSSGFGLQFAGAGTGSGNTIDCTTQAYVSSAAIIRSASGNSVQVLAEDVSTLKSTAISGSVSAQLDSGGSAAIGAAIAKNVIDSDVLAYIDGATVNSGGEVDAHLLVANVGIAGGSGGKATAKQLADTEASIGDASSMQILGSGNVNVKADSTSKSTSKAEGGGGGILNVTAFEAVATIGEKVNDVVDAATTTAFVAGTQLNGAGNLIVDANSTNSFTWADHWYHTHRQRCANESTRIDWHSVEHQQRIGKWPAILTTG